MGLESMAAAAEKFEREMRLARDKSEHVPEALEGLIEPPDNPLLEGPLEEGLDRPPEEDYSFVEGQEQREMEKERDARNTVDEEELRYAQELARQLHQQPRQQQPQQQQKQQQQQQQPQLSTAPPQGQQQGLPPQLLQQQKQQQFQQTPPSGPAQPPPSQRPPLQPQELPLQLQQEMREHLKHVEQQPQYLQLHPQQQQEVLQRSISQYMDYVSRQYPQLLHMAQGHHHQLQQPLQPQPPQLPPPHKQGSPDEWYYTDPSNALQGPFSSQDMREWLEAGYFKPTATDPVWARTWPFHGARKSVP